MKYEYKECPKTEIHLVNDLDLQFRSPMIHFENLVSIKDCVVRDFNIYGSYFLNGLYIDNCEFQCEISWQSGGHNREKIFIKNTNFSKFVDFEDCHFENQLILENITFQKGSNLLGNKGTPVEVIFNISPIISNVKGNINMNSYRIN